MINVVCNIDNSYLKYCIVMLTSLFVTNKDEHFHIYIIAGELSDEAKKVISSVVEDEYGQELSFYIVGDKLLEYCPIDKNGYISIATYYRCFLVSILPESISKVIYLDCDLIVNGPIKEFWESDIDSYAVGCVEDMWSGKNDHYSRLQYSAEYSYFNAGVLLINLNYWRKNNIESQIVSYIQKYPDRLLYNDQDVLNAVLFEQRKFLPYRWNMQDGFFRKKRKMKVSSLPAVDAEMSKAVIIHFTGGKKPWHDECVHPCKKLYLKYQDMTQWAGQRPAINYLARINRFFQAIQGQFGLKNTYRKFKV